MVHCLDDSLIDSFFEGIYTVDLSSTIVSWNKGAELIAGWKAEEVVGKRCSENILRHVDYQGRELCRLGCPLRATLVDGQNREANVFLHHKDGHRVPVMVRVVPLKDHQGTITGAMELFIDRSKRLDFMKRIESLRREAMTDQLTQIGNRRFGDIMLERAAHDLELHEVPYGFAIADIDHFKLFNDRYGHALGDKVLGMVAQSMLQAVRTADSLCRWGGEEFAVVIPNANPGSLAAIAERLRFLVEKSWLIEQGEKLTATISVGATLARPGEKSEDTVGRADELLYASKQGGRNKVTIG